VEFDLGKMLKKIWIVQLGASHTPYTHVEFIRGRDHVDGYEVVMVDVEKLMTCFDRDNVTLPLVSAWKESKVEGIRNFLNPTEGACEMPSIGFVVRNREIKTLFGLRSKTMSEAVASFTNGRHRSRYLQFAGAVTMPVEIASSEAPLLRRFCGI
jgi:hypothetical protein